MHAHPLKPPPALRRPRAAAALSSLQLGIPGGTPLFVKLVLSGSVTVDTPVALSTDDPTATMPATVTVPAGQSFTRFTVQTANPASRHFLLVRATLNGVTRLQQITIEPAGTVPLVTGLFQSDGATPLTHGPPGTIFIIRGSGFGSVPGQVYFDPTSVAAIRQWSDTQIIGLVPDPQDGPRLHESVSFARPGDVKFLPVAPDFAIDGPPTPPQPASIQPTGDGGWIIRGTGFGTRAGTVSGSGLPLVVRAWTPTAITVTAPPGPLGLLTIRRADGQWDTSKPLPLLPAASR